MKNSISIMRSKMSAWFQSTSLPRLAASALFLLSAAGLVQANEPGRGPSLDRKPARNMVSLFPLLPAAVVSNDTATVTVHLAGKAKQSTMKSFLEQERCQLRLRSFSMLGGALQHHGDPDRRQRRERGMEPPAGHGPWAVRLSRLGARPLLRQVWRRLDSGLHGRVRGRRLPCIRPCSPTGASRWTTRPTRALVPSTLTLAARARLRW